MPASAPSTYVMDNGWEYAERRLRALERIYDPGTIRRLGALGVGPGWRCLEVGAGGGSITRWLCSKVGPTGRVRAVDVDTRFVADLRAVNLDVERVDITTAEVPSGAYDLIHARAVLCHLPQRAEVLDRLVSALAPKGWLLLEDPDDHAASALGTGLHGEVLGKIIAGVSRAGFDATWARSLPGALHRRGLRDIGAESETPMLEGGSPTTEFLRLTALQARDLMLASGATDQQLEEWNEFLDIPAQWFPSFDLVAAWGRRREG